MEAFHDIRIEEIYSPSKQSKDSYLCEDFIIYPEGKEKSGGYVFGIVEMRATPIKESEKIVQVILNTIKEEYYKQINASPDPSRLNLETVFEHALQKTNDALMELIQIGHVNFAMENLNYLVAVAKPHSQTKEIDILFANRGLVFAYLLHKTKQNNYKVLSITEGTENKTENNQGDYVKIFNSILSGKIYNNDSVYICTELFNNYIPSYKVNKILTSNHFGTSIDYFKNIINNVKNNSFLTYCAIFIKIEEKKQIDDRPISEQSIDHLLKTKENTEKFLTPNFSLNLRKYFLKFFERKEKSNKKLRQPAEQIKVKFGVLKYFINAIKIIFGSLLAIGQRLLQLITGKKASESHQKETPKSKNPFAKSSFSWQTFNNYSKIIIIAIVLLVVGLGYSIYAVKKNGAEKAAILAYENTIKGIKQKISSLQINLITRTDENNLDLLKQIDEQIKYLPQADANQKDNFLALDKQVSTLRNKILKIEKIVPQLFFDAAAIQSNIANLSVSGDQIFIFTAKKLISLNTVDKKTNFEFSSDLSNIQSASVEDKNSVINLDNISFKQFDWAKKAFNPSELKINSPINSFELYNGNIYAVDAGNSEIIKVKFDQTGVISQQTWLKDKKDPLLNKAIDMAIDGNIYALTGEGAILKYFSGKKEDFASPTFNPAISASSSITTDVDFKNLYLLDPDNNRIIIIDKTGKLLKQLSLDNIQDKITSIAVDESKNQLYLSTKDKIYLITLK